MNEQWVNETWNKIEKKMERVIPRTQNKLPYTTQNGRFDDYSIKNPGRWTNGFWPGMMWLLYADTGKKLYKTAAENAELLMDPALEKYDGLHHDVGFLWKLSSGANYCITGNKKSRVRTLYAANVLASRYNIRGNYIRAWNDWGDGEEHLGWSIIDSMLNIPLLYWASEESHDPRFRYIAEAHADMCMKEHVRPDGSVKHIIIHDPYGSGKTEENGGQGYGVGSSWSRGQAWGLYGFTLSYIHTHKQEYLDTAKRIAHYFIANVCNDWLPKIDFRCPKEPVIYDSTAGAIAACGLLEIARCVPEFEQEMYRNAAIKLLETMEEKFCNWDEDEDSILQMGTERYHGTAGREIPIIYGDYFFIEAIYKLRGNQLLFW